MVFLSAYFIGRSGNSSYPWMNISSCEALFSVTRLQKTRAALKVNKYKKIYNPLQVVYAFDLWSVLAVWKQTEEKMKIWGNTHKIPWQKEVSSHGELRWRNKTEELMTGITGTCEHLCARWQTCSHMVGENTSACLCQVTTRKEWWTYIWLGGCQWDKTPNIFICCNISFLGRLFQKCSHIVITDSYLESRFLNFRSFFPPSFVLVFEGKYIISLLGARHAREEADKGTWWDAELSWSDN